MAFSYSPSNMYCYAIDKKSQKAFKKHLKQLGNCLPNVIVLEKEYSFDSAGHRQDQAHYDCSADLLQYPGWEYLMFSQVKHSYFYNKLSERGHFPQDSRRDLRNYQCFEWDSVHVNEQSNKVADTQV